MRRSRSPRCDTELASPTTDAASIDETLSVLRKDANRKDPPADLPITIAVRGATEETSWQGSLRVEMRLPVSAIDASLRGAKKALSP